jgi:hypothetical protein
VFIPIFIYCDDDIDDYCDFDGFGEYVLAYMIAYIGMLPLTYIVLGMLHGFDVWGLKGASAIIAMFVALIVIGIGEFFCD